MSIFQNSVLKTFKQDEKLVAARWAAFQNYKSKVEAIKDFKEEEYQDGFLKDIFESCLGYTLKTTNPSSFNLEREKKNETDSKKADGVIYLNSEIIAVIELKDTKTKNLDRVQQQAFWYLTQHTKAKYVIISNFDELRFYFDKSTAYESFSLFNLSYDEFCKLHLLLSFENIKDETALKIKEKTNSFEQDISKKLYKDFSHFRTLLFENIVKNNPTIDKQTLLRLTQKLCDRIIFILFAEDRDLLRANMIKEIREEFINQKFTNYSLYDIYKFYFEAINKGNDKLQIPQYNGGLFAVDELLDSLIIDDFILDENVQILSNYDFASEISVNILGHIFEQSLTDLEELQANIDNVNFDKTKSKRKKDGVFYTPEYITRYIVENTLGKMCSEKREELKIVEITPPSNPKKLTKQEQQTKENLQEYKNWLLNLKILDPACGSGAFLNQALEYLISEHKNLQNDLALMGDLFASYMVEEEILEHNLYGVDINEDAVEIAKLSLWLRTAKRGRALTKLADKIVCANSLLEMPFNENSFDVVIGNPPYVVLNPELLREYYFVKGNYNTYIAFVEKSLKLLKEKRHLGFIIPNTWFSGDNYSDFRKHIINEFSLDEIIQLPYDIFEAYIDTSIVLISKSKSSEYTKCYKYDVRNYQKEIKIENLFSFPNKEWLRYGKVFLNSKLLKIGEKVLFSKNNVKLGEISNINRGCLPPKDNEKFDKSDENNLRWFEEQVFRYSIEKSNLISYVNYNNLRENKPIELYKSEKLLARQLMSRQFRMNITYLNEEVAFKKNLYAIYNLNQDYKYLYILSVLNSTLFSFIQINFNTSLQRDDFPAFSLNDFKNFNIPKINIDNQEPFIKKADLMLELNKKLQELKQNFINELNLEKVSTKLQKFEELDFDDFVKEYAKAKKLKFADKLEERNFKNEWQRLFENDKKEVLEIQNQINITDKEIDQMVYKLYDLTPDEIKIVENN
ncbi:N-6 DNA methylase [Aliarcobacter skirrowii]|uniref:Eco57I restriction-modification methylase domain-containing protein n=1 Tax=Aliarcobacter skirrowii TaxID=28200 RepID=UPI0029BC56E4|nr:N-6 DNA methylase [Aliarcobacter skirrowii]MDX4063699.1 N-6 DNA methylase [Aliarcobacter skirrowii]